MSSSIPTEDGRFITTKFDDMTDEMTLTIETAEGEEQFSVIMPMDQARELAAWLIEGCAEDITPEKIIQGGRPELN